MRSNCNKLLPIVVALLASSAISAAFADDNCVDFKWDVSKERALFAMTPVPLTAGKGQTSAPEVVPNRLYKLRLVPQDQVIFPVSPGKKIAGANAMAGVAILKISVPGSYRIAIDLPLWIDVASNGSLVATQDFEGQRNCNPPHKIVVFDLNGAQSFILQLNGTTAEDSVLLTVTPTPSRKL